ncbi:hypothetical protein BTHE68_39220 [Burkholderia sp. THE68]|uniref:hypothetical protein n=1 Tax=Burkholderia sp. THE68 TaxID=758782 RepID=UPI001318E5F2|nr:hypothetical protein [Burkholderia sp. THE68]BBU30188.1 hypothetical protein BTHE68_39220 [Burkholderia sp. THE68]
MATNASERKHRPSPRAVNSLRNLWTQMLGVRNSPDFSSAPGLREACATQERLAKFECRDAQIFPLALNTFKLAAEIAVEKGGWESFNQLRREVYASSLPTLQANRKVKRSLGRQVNSLRFEIQELREMNQNLLRGRAVLISAYFDAVKTLRGFQGNSPEITEKLREHEARFDIRRQIGEADVRND